MNDDEKGKHFLELIDTQNNLQWSIVAKLTNLITSNWDDDTLKQELDELVKQHSEITKELNSLDDKSSLL